MAFRKLTVGDKDLTQHEQDFIGMIEGVVSNQAHVLRHWGDHSFQVAGYGALIAGRMKCKPEWIRRYCAALYLHDQGKEHESCAHLFVPEKGVFTPEEYRVANGHGVKGAEMTMQFLSMVYDEQTYWQILAAQLTHHQDFDNPLSPQVYGMLYPDKEYKPLKGKSIPLVGRIGAVADTFHALTSNRGYKRTWSVKHAALYLLMHSGTRFDPEIVEVFITKVLKINLRRCEFQVRYFPFVMTFADAKHAARNLFQRIKRTFGGLRQRQET